MGYQEAFPYRSAAEIFDEYAQLTAYKKDEHRQLDLSGLTDMSLQQYNEMLPVQWPVTEAPAAEMTATEIPGIENLSDTKRVSSVAMYSDGKFSTVNRRARFIAVTPRPPAASVSEKFPLILNTGRVRDHWHTMTRTGMSPRLSAHRIEPFVEVHPDDASRFGLLEGKLALINSEAGSDIHVRIRITDSQQAGSIFVPMHWNLQFSGRARVGSLIKTVVDPISGQPEFKHAVANIKPCDASWYGFIISRHKPELKYSQYWARSRGKGFWRYELAGEESPEDWAAHAKTILHYHDGEQWAQFYDKSDGHYRAARFIDGHLDSVIFIDSSILLPPRDWLISLFQKDAITAKERMCILRGTPPPDVEDVGKIICACFNIGEKTISKAISESGAKTTEAVGEICQAGTNCGSCRPEISELIRQCQ